MELLLDFLIEEKFIEFIIDFDVDISIGIMFYFFEDKNYTLLLKNNYQSKLNEFI